jgi:hypothetical protein
MPTRKFVYSVIVIYALASMSLAAEAAPSIEVTSHRSGQTVRDGAITLSGTASDPDGITVILVSINRGPWQDATWNGSRDDPKVNATWSVRLPLLEGANLIVVNVTNSANETANKTILIDHSSPQSDNGGVIVAGGGITLLVVLIALLAFRVKRSPPQAEDSQTVVKVEAPKEPDE